MLKKKKKMDRKSKSEILNAKLRKINKKINNHKKHKKHKKKDQDQNTPPLKKRRLE